MTLCNLLVKIRPAAPFKDIRYTNLLLIWTWVQRIFNWFIVCSERAVVRAKDGSRAVWKSAVCSRQATTVRHSSQYQGTTYATFICWLSYTCEQW